MTLGTLYLLPVPLGEDALAQSLPPSVQTLATKLGHFIAENAKTARAFLKAVGTEHDIRQISIQLLNEHTPSYELNTLLLPLLAGHDVGLISEAGCPGVADPGAPLVRLAHLQKIPVRPLVGPSAILLALMASGANGQQFAFHGYLPANAPDRIKVIQKLEKQSHLQQEAEIFIETPYRTMAMLDALRLTCHATTMLTVACNLTLPSEQIISQSIAAWNKTQLDLHKQPCVFVLYAGH
jgi:16S rRNA (cytidine1402-2'-O)-methyltransferase